MICHKCGRTILSLADYARPHECRSCYNATATSCRPHYNDKMRAYMQSYRLRRMLASAPESDVVRGGYKPHNTMSRGRAR